MSSSITMDPNILIEHAKQVQGMLEAMDAAAPTSFWYEATVSPTHSPILRGRLSEEGPQVTVWRGPRGSWCGEWDGCPDYQEPSAEGLVGALWKAIERTVKDWHPVR